MSERECAREQSPDAAKHRQDFPADFSAEEAAFARELRELFPLDQEELPPLFAQTLIEDEWRAPVPPGFEEKLSYRVFRQLHLPRAPLFPSSTRPPLWRVDRLLPGRFVRPMLGAVAATVLIMFMSIIAANPTFAAGLSYLLGQTGVIQVDHYPEHVSASVPQTQLTGPVVATVSKPPMPVFWFGPTVGKYTYDDYWEIDAQNWSDGPILDIHYSTKGTNGGTGILDVREFRVSPQYSAVVQVVQDGSVVPAYVDGAEAVYVDGQWDVMDGNRWHYGVRSELILEKDGVIIWIVGDQRDGLSKDALVNIANHLTTDGASLAALRRSSIHGVGRSLQAWFHDASNGEVYALIPRGVQPTGSSTPLVKMLTTRSGLTYAQGG